MPYDVVTTAGTKITVLSESESGGGGGDVTWDSIKNKPATFPPTIGTTATTAKAGDYQPQWDDITDRPPIPPDYILPAATPTELGGVKKGAAMADLEEGADTVKAINQLLANLRDAGIIAK